MKYTPPVYTAIENYARTTLRRFHMPAHGGAIKDGFLKDVSKYDVTELYETDNLALPTGVIKEAERLCALKFGAGSTLFSCGGATLCMQAALFCAVARGQKKRVFCHRKVHKSVINAFCLLGIEPVWIENFDGDFSDCGVLVFTWTDYYGNIAPYEKIESLKEKYGFITVTDNAHGAHLAFYDGGKLHPTRHNTDFSIDSLHKTLPVLTGGACLNIKDPLNYDTCRQGMSLFGSTSPNYLIMASVDYAVANISPEDLKPALCAVRKLENDFPRFFHHDSDTLHRDPFRVVLRSHDGKRLYDYLYQRGIKCEFCDASSAVLIVPWGAGEEYFAPLYDALAQYEIGEYNPENTIEYTVPVKKTDIRKALFMPSVSVPIEKALGKVSAREYSVYPPGIPLIVPGEVFSQKIIDCLKDSFDTVRILE